MGILNRLRGTDGPEPPAKAIVAAAMPMNGPGVRRINKARATTTQEQWQREAWYYYDAIGRARAPMVWIANAVSQADLHAADLDPDTGKPVGPTDDAQATAIANGALGGPSQRGQLLRLIALCWQVVGESWVVIRPRAGGKPDQWLVLAGNKVTAKGESWQYTDPYTAELVTLGDSDRLLRVWSPHPEDQSKADSAMRPALPICREIEKASQNIAARLDSRIATNGVMALADELDFPAGEHATSAASFMDTLMQAAEAGLQNPGQAASQVPLAFNAPGELIANGGAFAHYDLSTTFDGAVVELRQDGYVNLAQTLDMPTSVAEGTQDESNHWTAWQVEESTYKIYIEPLLKAVGDAITEQWFRPALRAAGWDQARAERVEIGWDTTAIVSRPDDRETLESAYEKLLISDEYYLTENGISVDAMPSPEERTRRFFEGAVKNAPTLIADPNVANALGLEIEVAPAAAGVDAEVTAGGELETPTPEPAPRALPGRDQTPPNEVPEGLVAAAELIVYDALSRAGGRLLTNQNRGQFKSTPRHELHTVIESPDLSPLGLLSGSFEFVEPVAEAFGLDAESLRSRLRQYCHSVIQYQDPHVRKHLLTFLSLVKRA